MSDKLCFWQKVTLLNGKTCGHSVPCVRFITLLHISICCQQNENSLVKLCIMQEKYTPSVEGTTEGFVLINRTTQSLNRFPKCMHSKGSVGVGQAYVILQVLQIKISDCKAS